MGYLKGGLEKFDSKTLRVPHIGWNDCEGIKESSLWKNIEKETVEKFSYYKIGYHIYADKNLTNIPGLKNSKSDIGQRRYEMYISILEKLEKKPNKILLADSRDVVFQSNIFDHSFKRPLNFFLESEKIMNDPRNVRWLKRTVGQQVLEKIKDNLISCSGTTLGNFEEIMNFVANNLQ